MKKWSWTLLFGIVVVILLAWATRENYDNYEAALKDVGQSAGYTDLSKPDAKQKAVSTASSDSPSEMPLACPANSSPGIQEMCFTSETAPMSACPSGSTIDPGVTSTCSNSNGWVASRTCPSGFGIRNNNDTVCYKSVGRMACQSEGYQLTPGAPGSRPTCKKSTSSASTGDKCKDEVANKQWSDVSEECKKSVTGEKKEVKTGNSTGGSSIIPGPNSGGIGGAPLTGSSGAKKGNIFGPAYTGMGDNAGDVNGNSKRDYPTLLGPKPKESRMVEGAGIANVSQNRTLVTSGALPGAANTGSDPNSQFFGTSRVPGGSSTIPGDQDLIPNPYLEFTPSNGSSKTEPVPYLSDFSAFFH